MFDLIYFCCLVGLRVLFVILLQIKHCSLVISSFIDIPRIFHIIFLWQFGRYFWAFCEGPCLISIEEHWNNKFSRVSNLSVRLRLYRDNWLALPCKLRLLLRVACDAYSLNISNKTIHFYSISIVSVSCCSFSDTCTCVRGQVGLC